MLSFSEITLCVLDKLLRNRISNVSCVYYSTMSPNSSFERAGAKLIRLFKAFPKFSSAGAFYSIIY